MRALTRPGFALLELLIGLVMLAMLATQLIVVVRSAGAVASRSSAALLVDRTLVSLQIFLRAELRDALDSDVLPLSPTRIGLSRQIGQGYPCADSGGVVLIADAAWAGTRLPEAGRDDALLLVDPVAGEWQRLPIDSVGRDRCPLDASPASRLDVPVHPGRGVVLRVLEPVELSAYRSGAADWFGLTPGSRASSVQPFAGPLTPTASRFVLYSDRLEITTSPSGRGTTVLQLPLGPR